jgi:hypothetical protein
MAKTLMDVNSERSEESAEQPRETSQLRDSREGFMVSSRSCQRARLSQLLH